MEPYVIIPIVLVAVLAIILIGSYVAYRIAFYTKRHEDLDVLAWLGEDDEPWKAPTRRGIEALKEKQFEDCYITSRDGLRLHALYYFNSADAPTVIQCHGYRSFSFRDFSIGSLRAIDERGFNLLLIDQRSHWKSEGHTICFGLKERFDLCDWIDFLIREKRAGKIILSGMSMGSATVLMAGGLPLPSEVVGIIADCPYSSAARIIMKVTRSDMKLPATLLFPFVYLGALIYGRFNLLADTPAKAIKRCRLPLLLVHGDADTFVPYEMSREIYESRPENTEFLTVQGADHGMSFVVDRGSYEAALVAFEEKILKD
ncbi:MAG: alpha/beta hydrolase [Clostridia bacterium]|nr:alpha/beta hydrolase [Clostridia bacterium]